MPYRTRAFCTKDEIPPLRQIFDYASTFGIILSADEAHGPTDVNSKDWTEVEISYKTGKSPLVVECNRDDGTEDCLVRLEIQEYIEDIGPPRFSRSKRRVIEHLKKTKVIIVSQLLGDIDEDGYRANEIFLNYFVDHCGGMIHADLEGFYDRGKVIVKVH